MSELLPTLRESLRETAERRYRRRRRPLVPALIAVAAVAVALILIGQRDGTQPADEVPATPTATSTPTSTATPSPAGTPRAMPKLDPKDLRATPVAPDDSSLKEALSLLDKSHHVVRAWKVRGLEGHVLLTRKGAQWCLSAPDPLTDHPDAERGVGCEPDSRFQRRGAYIGLVPADGKGGITVTVKPDLKTIRIRQR
jgi:hypothetical protein